MGCTKAVPQTNIERATSLFDNASSRSGTVMKNVIPRLLSVAFICWALTLQPGAGHSSAKAQAITPDFDSTGKVDFGDFILFAGAFGTKEARFDLNQNGTVDFQDFLIFAGAFGDEVPVQSQTTPLTEGGFWEFSWTSKTTGFAQGQGTNTEFKAGSFLVTLGEPVNIGGTPAHSVTLTGIVTDSTLTFGPRWTHIAVLSDGSLQGSTDGQTLHTLFGGPNTTWKGGGFFVTYKPDQEVSASDGTFQGQYNQLASSVVARKSEAGGCVYYSEFNVQICDEDERQISGREFYKPGIGPIGYHFTSSFTFSGGNFFSSTRTELIVELTATSFEAADGVTFNPPPWREIAPMETPRMRHASVAFNGEIYVLGGRDGLQKGSTELSSVEIYTPETDTWRSGTPLPTPMAGHMAEAIQGKIYVIRHFATRGRFIDPDGNMYIYDPASDAWAIQKLPDALSYEQTFDTGIISDTYIVALVQDDTVRDVLLYELATKTWFQGTGYRERERNNFSIAILGLDVYELGGYYPSSREFSNGILHYNSETGIWSQSADGILARSGRLKTNRYRHRSVVFNGKIITLGGYNSADGRLRDVEIFDPATGASETLPGMLRPREDFDAVVLNNRIYVLGGYDGTTALLHAEVYTPAP